MRSQPEETYIGIDVNSSWIQISYFRDEMKEPETISIVAGEEKYIIPTALCQKISNQTWHFGEEGKRLRDVNEGRYVENLLTKALADETIVLDKEYKAKELFYFLMKKVWKLAANMISEGQLKRLTFTVEEVTKPVVELLMSVSERLMIHREAICIQDYKESFYHFALSQQKEMWQYEVALFEYRKNYMICLMLKRNRGTKPTFVTISEQYLGVLPKNPKEKDVLFLSMIKNSFQKKIISTVYLIGDGFEEDWMKESLNFLCRGKRVFQGKNLYTKGACYSGWCDCHEDEWDFRYFCDYKTTEDIFIKIQKKDQCIFHPLVSAYNNKYEMNSYCEVLLEGDSAIELWIQEAGSKEAKIKILELIGLPKRPSRATRLGIHISSAFEGDLTVKVSDLGLGELFPTSKKVWEFEI